MKLSVIIVNYNVKHYVEQCVRSVRRAIKDMEAEVFVVDNHSQDGSMDYLRKRLDGVHLIDSNHNLGFARGNNIAIRQSQGEYVLLLNPDTFVSECSLREAVSFMDSHPQAGGLGVRMHNADGGLAPESRRAIPTPLISLKKMLGRDSQYYMSHLDWDKPARIEIISGAFCMLRRKALEQVGLLDEDYFMYGEDIDLSYRLLKGGWENWFLPVDIVHYKGESTQKTSFRYVHVFYQAMHIFFRKHYGHMSSLITVPIRAAIYSRATLALISTLYHRMRQSMGFVDVNDIQPSYLFIGSSEMLAEARRLASHKGLKADFRESSTLDLDDIEAETTVVCDTDAFSYEQIISAFAALPGNPLTIGTYSTATHVVITPQEIIQ